MHHHCHQRLQQLAEIRNKKIHPDDVGKSGDSLEIMPGWPLRPLTELQRSKEAQSATVVHLQACLSLSVFRRKLSRNELIIPAGLLSDFCASYVHFGYACKRGSMCQCRSLWGCSNRWPGFFFFFFEQWCLLHLFDFPPPCFHRMHVQPH